MLCMNEILYFIGDLGPLFIVLALTGLELGVAILQAYIFLICIYVLLPRFYWIFWVPQM